MRRLDAIAALIGVTFMYESRCMSGGARDVCLVFSAGTPEEVSSTGQGMFRACTDANYVQYSNDTTAMYRDVVDAFGGDRNGLCVWGGTATRPSWCFYAGWDGETRECAMLNRDMRDDAGTLTMVLLTVCCFACAFLTTFLAGLLNPLATE